MPRHYDRAAVDRALAFPRLIDALREGFATGCEAPVRHHHAVARGDAADATLLIMPAWQQGRRLGVKIVQVSPGNEALGLPTVDGLYLLFDATTGTPLAILDGKAITGRRTAATSALAARYLARPDAAHHLVIGAGA
jgi:alanine dehydrogenase